VECFTYELLVILHGRISWGLTREELQRSDVFENKGVKGRRHCLRPPIGSLPSQGMDVCSDVSRMCLFCMRSLTMVRSRPGLVSVAHKMCIFKS